MRAVFREIERPSQNIMLRGQTTGAGLETCLWVLALPVTCSVVFSQGFCFQENGVMNTESQNHRMVGAGRDLWGSS